MVAAAVIESRQRPDFLNGPWSIHAQNQIRKNLAEEGLKLIYRRQKQ